MRRLAISTLAVGMPLAAAGFLLPPPAGTWLLAALAGVLPVALMALGDPRRRLAPLWAVLAAAMGGSAVAVVCLAGRPAGDGLVAGLPPATVVAVLGLGIAPLVVTCWAWVVTFEDEADEPPEPPEPPKPAGRDR